MFDSRGPGLRCVDPGVGGRILDLVDPGVDERRRSLLEAHADVCDACRMTLELHRRLESGFRAGALLSRRPGRFRSGRRRGRVGWLAVGAVAATLASLMILPPRPQDAGVRVRGAQDVRFVRPVEGEVVHGTPVASWTEVPGASAYVVHLADPEGETSWSSQTERASLRLGTGDASLRPGRYRLLLSVVPADLLPPGDVSVAFQVGGRADVLLYRVRSAPVVTYGLFGLSLLLAGLWITRRPDHGTSS